MPRTVGTAQIPSQWDNAPNLHAVTQIFLDLMDEEVFVPLQRLILMRDLETAEGVWLDYLGELRGLPRPWVLVDDVGDERFGFAPPDTGFDQAPFAGNVPSENRAPLPDDPYRRLIKARQRMLRTDGTLGEFQAAFLEIDPESTFEISDGVMTVTASSMYCSQCFAVAARIGLLQSSPLLTWVLAA